MPEQIQQTGKTVVLKREMHKLHEALVVAEDVHLYEGQFVKLNNAGELIPAVADEPQINIFGYAIHERSDESTDNECTIISRAYSTVLMKASANVNAGPVKISGYDATDKLQTVAQTASATDQLGWALAPALSGGTVYVAVKN